MELESGGEPDLKQMNNQWVVLGGSVACCIAAKLPPTLLQPNGLQPARLLCLWDFSGKSPGALLAQGSNPCLLYCWPTRGQGEDAVVREGVSV